MTTLASIPHCSKPTWIRSGKHDYRVVQVTIDPQPWLRVHETRYPASQIYHFKPLDERVEVYPKPFRLMQDLTSRSALLWR